MEKARSKPLGKVNFISSEGNGKPTFINSNPKKSWIFDPSFGGSSNCWTGCTPRFMPTDFLLKTKYNMGLDWPIQYDELEPYYCEAEEIMTISGPDKTPYPMSKAYPQPAHALSTKDKILQKEYGELYISQPTARRSISGKRNKCCTSSICHLCPVQSKFTIENGLMDIYHDPRVEVVYQSQVFQLDTQNNQIQAVYYKKNDKEITLMPVEKIAARGREGEHR